MKKLTPNLMVDDVNKTIEYYKNILGFEVLVTVPETGQYNWALIQKEGVQIMLQSKDSLSEELPQLKGLSVGGTLTLYIDVDNVLVLYNSVKQKNVTIAKDLHKTFYGAEEFTIQDINGYFLTFNQPAN